jgi:hypothetical protein
MRLIELRNILFFIAFLYVLIFGYNHCTTRFQNNEISDSEIVDSLKFENIIDKDTINRLEFISNKGESFIITYFNDNIYIKIRGKRMKTPIAIPYNSPIDKIIPCNGIAINKGKDTFEYKDYYMYNDTILLLPVFDFGNRINLFVINTLSGKTFSADKPRKSSMLSTYLNWFIFNQMEGSIITSNSLDLDGKTVIHKFKIINHELIYVSNEHIQSKFEIYSDDTIMKEFIRVISE